MSEQRKTTDHKAIQSFAEEHNLKPASVKDTQDASAGMIRLMQPGSGSSESEGLKEISWNEWFQAFEENKLALIYEAGDGKSFNKLVARS